jgi:hypothetical protein
MAGEAAPETAERIADETRLFGERMASIRAGASGLLAVATVSTAKYFAPRLLAAFRQEHPDVELRLLFGNRAETIAALQGLHPYVLIAPPFHPLAGLGAALISPTPSPPRSPTGAS